MPKIGMEPQRRDALIAATIAEVGAVGLVDVTVGRIAKRAGVSPALAHHYFGSKTEILAAAMRRILADYGATVRAMTAVAQGPRARLDAIIDASFGPKQFEPAIVSAWLAFYVEAQRTEAARRVFRVYVSRLDSNLVHALRQLVDEKAARRIAGGLASLIDGVYLRAALQRRAPEPGEAIAMARQYLDVMLEKETA